MSELNLNELKSKLEEKLRIENFLRAEVKALWAEINRIKGLPFFGLFERAMSRYVKFQSYFKFKKKQKKVNYKKSENTVKVNDTFSKTSLDFLFLVPTNNQEIGGINTTFKLVQEMINNGIKDVAIFTINQDPTVDKLEFLINIDQFNKIKSIKNIILTGIDCVPFYLEIKNKSQHKLIINLLGPDFMFFNNWNLSKNFIGLLKTSDLILCLTPYLEKLVKILNVKSQTFITLLGPDKSIFNLKNVNPRDKTILVSCRSQFEKGLKFLIPSLAVIREKGWKIIGFGDLPDHAMANEFDEFVGRVSLENLSKMFNESKYLIDPSLIEGLGLTALEAASCGCLPIILNRNSFDELFGNSQKPFIEISNFVNPTEILQILNQELEVLPLIIAKQQYLDFKNGATKTIKKLIEFN